MTRDDDLRRTTRLLACLGMASGLVLVTRPQQVLDRLAPAFPAERRGLVRALGARLLVQHGAVLAAPDRRLVRLGSAVDLLHAASMVPIATSPRYGRAARISGAFAACYAAVGAMAAPRQRG